MRGTTAVVVLVVLVVLVLVALVALVACGGGGGGDDGGGAAAVDVDQPLVGEPADPSGSVVSEHPPSTEPPLVDLDDATAVVVDKVTESARLVDELMQDPAVVDDPSDDRLARLRELYSAESPVPDELEAQLRSLAEQGRRLRPAPSGFFRRLGIYDTTTVDETALGFYVCSVEDVEIVDAAGVVVDQRARVFQGNGAAVRVDGVWRLLAMVPIDGFSRPLPPGNVNPDLCDAAATAAEDTPD